MSYTLPRCPYCGSRMLPQVTEEKLVSYRCTNRACLAVSPHAVTFHEAAGKAAERAEKPLKWHDRKADPPIRPGDYLCEYVFAPEGPMRVKFFGVLSWYADGHFQHENSGPVWHDQTLAVIRWLDFGGGNTR